MKINIIGIISSHIRTLYNAKSGKFSYQDFVLFYIAPLILGCISFKFDVYFNREAYNLSITFFGIFIALLLNIQVAIFSVYTRKIEKTGVDREDKEIDNVFKHRRQVLLELNSNISYLILFCTASLVAIMFFYLLRIENEFASFICIYIYSHFILTFVMIAKRSHYLFLKEYSDP